MQMRKGENCEAIIRFYVISKVLTFNQDTFIFELCFVYRNVSDCYNCYEN